jgi:LCP family protein required for cell wall assembly
VPPGKGPKPRRAARVLSWIAVLTSLSVLAVAATGYLLVGHYEGNITKLEGILGGLPGQQPVAAAPNDAQNFLIVGSDSRGNLKAGEGTQGSGTTFVAGQRSDTVILAHLYGGDSNKVQLISFPRDSVVDIPEYTDPTTGQVHRARQDRINSAFAIGGPKLLIATVQQFTGVQIDHYLQVDFQGFQSMVDKLGGVDVCLSRPAVEHDSGINLTAGKHHISGAVALAFVRQRKGLANGDIDRIKRQQQFIGAMVRKVLSAGTLANPFKLNGFLNVATASLQADENLDFGTMRSLALRMRSIGAGNVIFTTAPVSTIDGYLPGLGSVVLLDKAKNEQLFAQIRQDIAPGTPTPKPTGSAAPAGLIVPPSGIRVQVYNGSGINGLGRRAVGELGQVGFQVVGDAQTRGSGATTTTVSYGPTKADSARTLAAAIPGATLQADPSLGNVLQVVLGTSYTGTRAVTLSDSTPASSPTTASAPPAVSTALDDPCAP